MVEKNEANFGYLFPNMVPTLFVQECKQYKAEFVLLYPGSLGLKSLFSINCSSARICFCFVPFFLATTSSHLKKGLKGIQIYYLTKVFLKIILLKSSLLACGRLLDKSKFFKQCKFYRTNCKIKFLQL